MLYRRFFKRLIDFCLALILFILLMPIMIIVSFLVYFSIGFPIFDEIIAEDGKPLKPHRYKKREGMYKKTFRMYKFRTKFLNSRHLPKAERYTNITRFLDIIRANELPQLWNVIKGDMAFVGPRPFIAGEILPDVKIPKERYLVRPGVTGLSQATDGRSATHEEKLAADIKYYQEMSLWLDFKIIMKTPLLIYRSLKGYLRRKEIR